MKCLMEVFISQFLHIEHSQIGESSGYHLDIISLQQGSLWPTPMFELYNAVLYAFGE